MSKLSLIEEVGRISTSDKPKENPYAVKWHYKHPNYSKLGSFERSDEIKRELASNPFK